MHFHFIIPKCELFFIIHSKTLLRYKLKWKIGRVKWQINRNTLSQNHCVTNLEIEIFVSKIPNFSLSLSLFIPLVFLLRKKKKQNRDATQNKAAVKNFFTSDFIVNLLKMFGTKNGVVQKNCSFSLFFFLSMCVCGFLFNFFFTSYTLVYKNFFFFI